MDNDLLRLRAADPATGEPSHDSALASAARRYALSEVRPRRRRRLWLAAGAAGALIVAPGVALASGALSIDFGNWEGGGPLATSGPVFNADGDTCGLALWMTPVDTIGEDTDHDGYVDVWNVEVASVEKGPLIGLTDEAVASEETPTYFVFATFPTDASVKFPTTFAESDYDDVAAWAQAQDWNDEASEILRAHGGDGTATSLMLDAVRAEAAEAGFDQDVTAALLLAETCTGRG